MECVTLQNGIEMPVLGFRVDMTSDCVAGSESVLAAIRSGFRLIDTGSGYRDEKAVGKAIRKCGIQREHLFITAKLSLENAGYSEAKQAFEKTLERLELDYLDLYIIHEPAADMNESWKAAEELYNSGKIRAIGVKNFNPDALIDLISYNKVIPMVNQIESLCCNAEFQISEFLHKKDILTQYWVSFPHIRRALQRETFELSVRECDFQSVQKICTEKKKFQYSNRFWIAVA